LLLLLISILIFVFIFISFILFILFVSLLLFKISSIFFSSGFSFVSIMLFVNISCCWLLFSFSFSLSCLSSIFSFKLSLLLLFSFEIIISFIWEKFDVVGFIVLFSGEILLLFFSLLKSFISMGLFALDKFSSPPHKFYVIKIYINIIYLTDTFT
jgi:hypothetical protein